ncbi:hypothetical protein BBJ28_00013332 [Nothophytophthora sp. Chile5]|nr:hypothetical protein BBJ28_00013332 [Nothophytophthora sp. Chile5]
MTGVVAPLPSSQGGEITANVRSRALQFLATALRWVRDITKRLDGQYTVSKLDVFETFRLETSRWRVAAILILTPVPCVVLNLLLECIPMHAPSSGLRGSGYFQLRVFLTAIFASLSPALVKKDCVPNFPASSWKDFAVHALVLASICVATNVVLSLVIDVFPVPFGQFTPILPMALAGRLLLYRRLSNGSRFRAQSTKVDRWLGMQVLPILVYPVFTALFMTLTPDQQPWMSLLLPVLKIVLRRCLWTISKDDSDLAGVITSCVGHLYHVLFTAMCLQNSKSLETLAAVVVFNTARMLLNCRYILSDSAKLRQTKRHLPKSTGAAQAEDNVGLALTFAQEERVARALHWNQPSLLMSTYPGYCRKLSTAVKPLGFAQILPWNEGSRPAHRATAQAIQVLPRPTVMRARRPKSTPSAWTAIVHETSAAGRQQAFICDLTSALYQTEMILLRSYITIYATTFYGPFQLRHFLATVVHSVAPAMVKRDCVPEFPVGSWKGIAGFALVQALVAMGSNAVISVATGVSPVPFAHFTPSIPMTITSQLICY